MVKFAKSGCYLLGLSSQVLLNFKFTCQSPGDFFFFLNEDRDGASDCIFNKFPGDSSKVGIHWFPPNLLYSFILFAWNYGHLSFYALLKIVTPLLWQLKRKVLGLFIIGHTRKWRGGEAVTAEIITSTKILVHSPTFTCMAVVLW